MVIQGPDLTIASPRSLRVRLGGFVILPRTLDKGRATIAGKNGRYQFNCPMDRRFFEFTNISPNSLMNQLATGKTDESILGWVRKMSSKNRGQWEIEAWADYESRRVPNDAEERKIFSQILNQIAPSREDIVTWFDLLDLDDYVSYGGKP